MPVPHQHLIVRARTRNTPNNPQVLKDWMAALVTDMGMQIANLPNNPNGFYCHEAGNRGVTCVGIIETSHVALHAWDEDDPGLVQLDVYTCSTLDVQMVMDHFKVFDPESLQYKFIDREHGLLDLDGGTMVNPIKTDETATTTSTESEAADPVGV